MRSKVEMFEERVDVEGRLAPPDPADPSRRRNASSQHLGVVASL